MIPDHRQRGGHSVYGFGYYVEMLRWMQREGYFWVALLEIEIQWEFMQRCLLFAAKISGILDVIKRIKAINFPKTW